MIRRIGLIVSLVLTVSLAMGLPATGGQGNPARISAAKASAQIPFDKTDVFVQINATDSDVGLQLALDGEAWKSLKVFAPGGRKIVNVSGKGKLKSFGLTGLTFESETPGLDEIEEFKAVFPEGEYVFRGKTVDGQKLVDTATLTHDFPAGPVVVAPDEDAFVPPDNLVVSWDPVTEPPGIVIVAYQVIVTQNDPHRVFSFDLSAGATSVTVPPELLESDKEYKLEVMVQEESGNQTATELLFRTN